AGYLDDEIIVLPDTGHNWITKTVTPGGENDNKLLLEHNDWDAENTTTVGSLISIEDAGAGITITPTGTLPPEGTAWFVFKEYEDEYDAKNHSKIRAKEGLKYFIIDVAQFANGKVKTDGDDVTAGYLDDEILVNTGPGNFWLTKTVIPGGENDNQLLLEHDGWNDSRISSTTKVVDIFSAGGGVTLTSNVPPGNRAYIKFEGWNVSRDPAGHMKMSGTTDYYAYWMELPEPTAEGDMIYASLGANLQWSVLNRGASQSLLYINGFTPEWLAKGNNESILTTQGGNLSWFDVGQNDSILTTVSGSLTWYAKGDDESILLTRAGSFHWLPSGLDQSLLYVNGTQVDWFGNPSYDAVLINSATAGGLAWFPKGDDESIYITRNGEFNWLSPGGDQALLHINGDALAWFDSSLLPAVLTSDESGLSWTIAGDDESIFISRGGLFDWLAKGNDGSLLSVATGALSWLPKGGDQALLHIDGDTPAWFEAGASQSMLIVGSTGNLSWKPKGPDESIYITRGGNLDWLAKGGDKAVLYVSGGNLSWLPGPTSATQVLGGDPGWTGNMQWITVVTDVRYDSSAHKLQKKTRNIRVVDAGTESGWTDFATAVEGCSN
ncbi:MAG: hypothetical protein JW849_09355, partial [Phycisphaerae bacterium]|nr:hypothetical protein [Phycisphaerae bacterium]